MEEVMSSSLQGFLVKIIWIHGDHECKMNVWEGPFIPSHLTFKKVSNFTQFHAINHTTIKQSINLSIYYNIPKFRILGCYNLLLLLVSCYNLSYHKTICYHLFQYLQRIPCWKPLIISAPRWVRHSYLSKGLR